MPTLNLKPYLYAAVAIAFLLAGYKFYSYVEELNSEIASQKQDYKELNDKYEKCLADKALESANNSTLRTNIELATTKSLALKKEYDDAKIQYAQYISKAENEKHLMLDKYIKKEVKSDECKDVKDTLDSLVDYINAGMQ